MIKKYTSAIFIVFHCISFVNAQCTEWNPGHYMLVFPDKHTIDFNDVWNDPLISKNFKGVQVRYNWEDLEPTKGNYNFTQIINDIHYIDSMNTAKGMVRHLVIQLKTKANSQSPDMYPGPAYIATDPAYQGGWFHFQAGGWAPKIWVPALNYRIDSLIKALGARFDAEPLVEAIVTEESALGSGVNCPDATGFCGDRAANGFTVNAYKSALMETMDVAKKAFPTTVVIQYINGYPDLVNAAEDSALADLAHHADSLGLGIGGPDIRPVAASFLYDRYKGKLALGSAAQAYEYNGTYTAAQLFKYAVGDPSGTYTGTNTMHLNYVFWLRKNGGPTNEITFAGDVVPYIDAQNARINTACPTKVNCCSIATNIDQQTSSSFNIYPNPASDRLMINRSSATSGNIVVQIYTIMGKEIVDQVSKDETMNVDVSALAAGTYFIVVSDNKNSLRYKFIKD